jgi:hypothetical protein
METALALVRLALERGWALGLLMTVFCGLALVGPLSLPLPAIVKEWSGAGVLFGIACIIVSLCPHLISASTAWAERRREKTQIREELSALAKDEEVILRGMVLKNERSITGGRTEPLFQQLVHKGLLAEASRTGDYWAWAFTVPMPVWREMKKKWPTLPDGGRPGSVPG